MPSHNTAVNKRTRATADKLVSVLPAASETQLNNAIAEQAVLNAVLYDPSVYFGLADILQPSDFYDLWHGYVWYCFEQLEAKGQPIDLVTVDELLRANHYGDDLRLAKLGTASPQLDNALAHAHLIKDYATVRRVLLASQQIKDAALVPGSAGAVDMLIDQCNQYLFEATEQYSLSYDAHVQAGIHSMLDAIDSRMERQVKSGFNFHFDKLDERVGSIQPGELAIIAGYAGTGKTTFMLDIILKALLDGEGIALFSLEMTREEVIQALIAKLSGVSKKTLKNGILNASQYQSMIDAAGIITRYPLYIYDRSKYPTLTPLQFRRTLRALLTRERIDCALIDGLWLMEPSMKNGNEDRPRDVHTITRDLITAGTDLNIPVVLMHQYRDEYADRQQKRGARGKQPSIRDLAESAAVKRNAPVIIGLHRPGQFESGVGDHTYAYVLKNRNADFVSSNPIEFAFDRASSKYHEV